MALATLTCVFAVLCTSAGTCEDRTLDVKVTYQAGVPIAELSMGLADPFPVAMTDGGFGPLVFSGAGIFSPVLLTVPARGGAALISVHPGLLRIAYSGAGTCSATDERI